MASTVTRKRPRATTKTRSGHKPIGARYLVDARGTRFAVVLDLAEYRRLVEGRRNPTRMAASERARLVALARRAEGHWQAPEYSGTSVEIVRNLRDEWRR
jgi:hypothetical protein